MLVRPSASVPAVGRARGSRTRRRVAARAGEVVQVDFAGQRHLDGGVRFHALNQIDVASHHAGRWKHLGRQRHPNAPRLTITADSGGSNSSRTRLWKAELQKLSDETGLEITVCHFPPGTGKWNAIEHRLFSFIGTNWRGKPLESLEFIIHLIAGATTNMG
jgi:hypothetical protein